MPEGHLTVQVVTSAAKIPIPDASVAIMHRNEDKKETLLAFRLTDQSGNTTPVALSAPPAAESTEPGTPLPFATVDIAADKIGYARAFVENVQIFADNLTLQTISLIPHEQAPGQWSDIQEFVLTPQNL